MIIIISTSIASVLRQVAQSSAYTGAKRQDDPKAQDPDALDRISTVDEDTDELTHFFNELRIPLAEAFSSIINEEGISIDGDTYNLSLNVYDGFNQALLPVMNYNLFSYFVDGILGAWLSYMNLDGAERYAASSANLLVQLKGSTFQRAFTRKMYPY